jgi:hypothetical protein
MTASKGRPKRKPDTILTDQVIRRAFSIMGEFLRDRKTVGEIAVYGGSAILLQFDWRTTTHDVVSRS